MSNLRMEMCRECKCELATEFYDTAGNRLKPNQPGYCKVCYEMLIRNFAKVRVCGGTKWNGFAMSQPRSSKHYDIETRV